MSGVTDIWDQTTELAGILSTFERYKVKCKIFLGK
jgi:hypothetical protein